MNTLKPGDKIANGATVLASRWVSANWGYALCRWRGPHPLVTWRVYEQDGEWHAEVGHYFLDSEQDEAYEDYLRR